VQKNTYKKEFECKDIFNFFFQRFWLVSAFLQRITLLEAYNVMRHLSSEQIHMKWKIIEKKYALGSITRKDLNVPKKPKLKCLGFTYNGAKLFNMLPCRVRETKNPDIFKTLSKEWIWENIPSY
jgi:hypothetical protein